MVHPKCPFRPNLILRESHIAACRQRTLGNSGSVMCIIFQKNLSIMIRQTLTPNYIGSLKFVALITLKTVLNFQDACGGYAGVYTSRCRFAFVRIRLLIYPSKMHWMCRYSLNEVCTSQLYGGNIVVYS